ncbi:hypothetical protein AWB78_08304 [Caballeronia calidae]|uniref:Uncharacterized protein n=1 Tax=Caballeronia calidae TaxID=1777139 RepID=A0A158EJD8_9BURK|nr:hypothetical protein [Caballeronia calidae]SAL06893.1 hypothetical protein AWB78_08304 [Caballeronia calidae]
MHDDPLYAEARALAGSIAAIRRATGKMNPTDLQEGSEEWERVCLDFVNDLRWALGLEKVASGGQINCNVARGD